MYTLYWSPESGAFVVQAVLEELGLPYRREPVLMAEGRHREPAYLALNPMAQVPTLLLPDGTVITESAAMVTHLCDMAPAAGLLPPPGTSGRAVAYRWLFWLATGFYETDLRFYYPDRYTDDPEGAAAVKRAALARMDHLAAIAADLVGAGPWALGDRFSAVDLYLTMLLLWHPDPAALQARHPNLAAVMAGVRARPAVARIWAENYGGG